MKREKTTKELTDINGNDTNLEIEMKRSDKETERKLMMMMI